MTVPEMSVIDLPPGSVLRITTFDFLPRTGRKTDLLPPPPTVPRPVQDGSPSSGEPVEETK